MEMTYEEAIDENPSVSRAVAERECKNHAANMADMVAELGDHAEYQARDLLVWLGY